MRRLFIDSDVILDALLKRPEFVLAAVNIINLANNNYDLVTSAVAFVNVHYFLDKADRKNKFPLLKNVRSLISIIEVGETEIDLAMNGNFADFEDAVQYYAALNANVNFIITRNIKDYQHSSIPVLTPEQFLKTL